MPDGHSASAYQGATWNPDALVRALVSEALPRADAGGSPLAWPGSAAERLRRLVTRLVEARRAEPERFLLFQHVASDPATPPDLLEPIQARGRAVTEAMRQLAITRMLQLPQP